MTSVIHHRPAKWQGRRGVWSSFPPRGALLFLLPPHSQAAWRVHCYEGQPSPPLYFMTGILVRLVLVTRTRDSLIYLEKKRRVCS